MPHPSITLPAVLHPPFEFVLARSVPTLPGPSALPGGSLYEPKWDGFRAVLLRDGDAAALWSRQGKDLSAAFPDLIAAAADQIPPGCVVDGEAVIFADGRLDFEALQERLGRRSAVALARARPASFAAFDVLAVAGRDCRQLTLHERRHLLDELAAGWSPPLNLTPVSTDPAQAQKWFEELSAAGVEGVMVKGAGQTYQGGKRIWLKVKRRDTFEVVCAAVIGLEIAPRHLVIGLPIGGKLRIVGRTGLLRPPVSAALGRSLKLAEGTHPWPPVVTGATLDRFNATEPVRLTRVEPFTVEISADVAWSGKAFRHSVRFVRVRPEIPPEEVVVPEALRR